mgnify:CR=1 FL=1
MPYYRMIRTMAGVTSTDDPAGFVEVRRADGDTMVGLTVMGTDVALYLDRHMVADLMIALGAAAVDL